MTLFKALFFEKNEKIVTLTNFFYTYVPMFLLNAGVHINVIFSPLNVGLMKISRSRFKQSKNPLLISRSYVVACFVNFWVIFGYIWVEIVFLKGLEKFREIRKIEDLMTFKN